MIPPDADVFPASSAQERMWFLAQFDPDRAVYNINMWLPMPVEPPFDPALMEGALAGMVQRHETLRTIFGTVDDRVVQAVLPGVPVEIGVVDLAGGGAPEAAFDELALALSREPFELGRPPLWRARLARLADDDWRLVFVVDHTVFDGRSSDTFVRELFALYRARLEGRDAALPPLAIQYADYTVWQEGQLTEEVVAAETAYWRDRLAGLPADTGLVTDRPRPRLRDDAGGLERFALSRELTARLEAVARGAGATPFVLFLTAFAVVLARWSGRGEVVVGCPVSLRGLPELEPLIGMFVNVVVVRIDLEDDPDVATAVDRVRDALLDALEHQQVPFERLVEALHPVRDPGRPPLYQIAFNLVPSDTRGQIDNGTVKVDLALDLNLREGRLHGRLEYALALFDAATARRIADAYQLLLGAVGADPRGPVTALPLLTDADRRTLRAWAQGAPGPGTAVLLPAMLAKAARRAGDTPAVVSPAGTVSHAQLDRDVERLARVLVRRGVGSGTAVGVCARRSAGLVTALLAVLRAGGTCVPLDPAYPPERLALLCAGAGVELVVTTADLAGRVPPGLPTVAPDGPGPDGPGPAGGEPLPAPHPEQLAYVIATSGSTGVPKAVGVTHRALARRVRWMRDRYRLRPGDRVLQFASPAFDTHAEELYPCLLAGAALVPLPPELPLPDFLATAEGRTLTVLDLPTSYWVELVVTMDPALWPAGLRLVVLGADPLPGDALAAWYRQVGEGVELCNTYGPTEATVIATAATMTPGETALRPTIGRPVDDTTVQLLDDRLRPVPIGAPGELCIGGGGLARGYLRDPRATAERFVPDPAGPPGARLYRTGDLARHRGDGRLEFLGRRDDQVKIRGFRVEPGEVEAALRAHPGVAGAAVVVRDDGVGDRLVGYAVRRGVPAPDPDELRRHLARHLPAHLVPEAVVILDRLPLTPRGKLDREALPPPGGHRAGPGHVAPATPAEEMVAAVWAEVLGVEEVGALDDFFDLGGHSLLATRAASRLAAAAGRPVLLRVLFTERTVRAVARAIDGDR